MTSLWCVLVIFSSWEQAIAVCKHVPLKSDPAVEYISIFKMCTHYVSCVLHFIVAILGQLSKSFLLKLVAASVPHSIMSKVAAFIPGVRTVIARFYSRGFRFLHSCSSLQDMLANIPFLHFKLLHDILKCLKQWWDWSSASWILACVDWNMVCKWAYETNWPTRAFYTTHKFIFMVPMIHSYDVQLQCLNWRLLYIF